MILLTGHQGFVGTALLTALQASNEKVIGLEKTGSFFQWQTRLAALAEKHVFKTVLHCGAISDNQYKNLDIFEWNTYSVKSLAAVCHRQGSHLIYISSQTARAPKTIYGHSKKLAEMLIKTTPGVDACILQPFNIWGSGERQKPRQCQSLPYRLAAHNLEVLYETERDYIHSSDVVRAIQHAMGSRIAGTYHLGTGTAIRSAALARCIRWNGYSCEPTPDWIERWTCANPSKFLPGWHPKIAVLDRMQPLETEIHYKR